MNYRPRVNLDGLGVAIDEALETPVGRTLCGLFPAAAAEVRAARSNLPALAGEAQRAILDTSRRELAAIERDAIRGVKRGLRSLFPKGRR